ncbi:MAG: hypothetical protein QG568_154 [Patescibacteria group bacterium]|nr:hypothetical protein [Patescibacteria group bacterium]
MKYLALCLTVACALLSSCASDGFIRCGTFGPGQPEHYRPITGLPGQHTFQRNIVLDPGCRTGHPGIYSQSRVIRHPVPVQHGCYPQRGWQQPSPMFGFPLQHRQNWAGPGQANFCPPMGRPLPPEPLFFNFFTGRWERRCR